MASPTQTQIKFTTPQTKNCILNISGSSRPNHPSSNILLQASHKKRIVHFQPLPYCSFGRHCSPFGTQKHQFHAKHARLLDIMDLWRYLGSFLSSFIGHTAFLGFLILPRTSSNISGGSSHFEQKIWLHKTNHNKPDSVVFELYLVPVDNIISFIVDE